MPRIDLLAALVASPGAQTWMVSCCRAAGAFAIAAPPLGGALPSSVRATLVLAVAPALAAGREPSAVASTAGGLALAAAIEVLLGLLIGLPVRLAIEALRHAGELHAVSALAAPSGSRSLLDADRQSVTAHAAVLAGIAVALALGADRAVLQTLGQSFRLLPAGHLPSAAAMLRAVEALGSHYFQVVACAVLPVFGMTLAADATLALVARASGLEASNDTFRAARALLMIAVLGAAVPLAYAPAAAGALAAGPAACAGRSVAP
ncbi:MAG: flagellar biosynthetic protein FliR [Candidatus Wallbacteria bacterium]|nr:flagellar biosynthetic protein FliR [Candidatus Wallbacteria bacterium]